jgi:hypothetical protein
VIHFRCPQEYTGRNIADDVEAERKSLFMGGGISGTPPWQDHMVSLLSEANISILNPRRLNFDITDPTIQHEQVEWEFNYLRKVDGRMFWFCKETLCPITLFEYGYWLAEQNKAPSEALFVGIEPGYAKEFDVLKQLELLEYEWIKPVNTLESLAAQIIDWTKHGY